MSDTTTTTMIRQYAANFSVEGLNEHVAGEIEHLLNKWNLLIKKRAIVESQFDEAFTAFPMMNDTTAATYPLANQRIAAKQRARCLQSTVRHLYQVRVDLNDEERDIANRLRAAEDTRVSVEEDGVSVAAQGIIAQ